jgi:hypothetical protein
MAGGPGAGQGEKHVALEPPPMGSALATGRLEEVELLPAQCDDGPPASGGADVVHVLDVDGDGALEVLAVDEGLELVVRDVEGPAADPCSWGEVVHRVPLVQETVSVLYSPGGLERWRGEAVPEKVRMDVLGDGRSLRVDLAALPAGGAQFPDSGPYGYLFLSFLVTFDELPLLAAAAPATFDAREIESVVYWTERDAEDRLRTVKMTWSLHPKLDRLVAHFARDGGLLRADTETSWAGWADWVGEAAETPPPGEDATQALRHRLEEFFPLGRSPELVEALHVLSLLSVETLVEDELYQEAYDRAVELGITSRGFDDPSLETRRLELVSSLPSLVAGGWHAEVHPVSHVGDVEEVYWHIDGRLVFRDGGGYKVYEADEARPLEEDEEHEVLDEVLPVHEREGFRWTVRFRLRRPPEHCPAASPEVFARLDVCHHKATSRCNSLVFAPETTARFPWSAGEAPAGEESLDLLRFGVKRQLLVGRRDLLVRMTLDPVPDKDAAGELEDECGGLAVDTFDEVETLTDLTGQLRYLFSSPYTHDGLGYLYGGTGGVWLGRFELDEPPVLVVPLDEEVERAVWGPGGDRIAIVDEQGALYVAEVTAPGLPAITIDESEIA